VFVSQHGLLRRVAEAHFLPRTTVPASGASSSAMIRNRVDLPAPRAFS
jgi:hypothetical protein